MKNNYKKLLRQILAIITSSVLLYSCSTTIKIPKHPGPGEPPTPPKVEIHKDYLLVYN